MDYQVELEMFRGPMDLLLYLVKRHEVDVCDIPIYQVTEQFLHYIEVLNLIDVEKAGDFLVMAATLMEIKSRMLLPRDGTEPAEEADPRFELVKQLVEYKKFKEAAAVLEARAESQLSRLPRQHVEPPRQRDLASEPLQAVELWDLVSAFSRLMRETLALSPQQIVADQTPIHVYMRQILDNTPHGERRLFASLFTPPYQRARLVGLFLAILELIKEMQIAAEQDELFGPIWIRRLPGKESEQTLGPPDATLWVP